MSVDAHKRFREHKSLANTGGTYLISKAIRKYKDEVVLTTLLQSSDAYCYEVEEKLRPHSCIGWNLVAGGGLPPMLGKVHGEETRKKISKAWSVLGNTAKRSAQFKRMQAGIDHGASRERLLENPSWLTPHAEASVWLRASEVYAETLLHPKRGFIKIESVLGFRKYSLKTMLCKIKTQGWNPNEDPSWSKWVKSQ